MAGMVRKGFVGKACPRLKSQRIWYRGVRWGKPGHFGNLCRRQRQNRPKINESEQAATRRAGNAVSRGADGGLDADLHEHRSGHVCGRSFSLAHAGISCSRGSPTPVCPHCQRPAVCGFDYRSTLPGAYTAGLSCASHSPPASRDDWGGARWIVTNRALSSAERFVRPAIP
jgi:hypothetical protein